MVGDSIKLARGGAAAHKLDLGWHLSSSRRSSGACWRRMGPTRISVGFRTAFIPTLQNLCSWIATHVSICEEIVRVWSSTGPRIHQIADLITVARRSCEVHTADRPTLFPQQLSRRRQGLPRQGTGFTSCQSSFQAMIRDDDSTF